MRISYVTLLPLVVSLAAWVVSAHDTILEAREWVDDLSTRELEYIDHVFERRDLLSDFTTRDLIDELSERVERRGNSGSKPKTYKCPYCGTNYATEAEAKHCATNPQMLGGCKVNGAVQAKKPGRK